MDSLTIPASHYRAIRSAIRGVKPSVKSVTLKHDDDTTTFAGQDGRNKVCVSGKVTLKDGEARITFAKKPTKRASKAEATPEADAAE